MLQLELRINGCLIDCVDIVRTGFTTMIDGSGVEYIYDVKRLTDGRELTVIHNPAEGAVQLAALALAALTKKPRKTRGKQ